MTMKALVDHERGAALKKGTTKYNNNSKITIIIIVISPKGRNMRSFVRLKRTREKVSKN